MTGDSSKKQKKSTYKNPIETKISGGLGTSSAPDLKRTKNREKILQERLAEAEPHTEQKDSYMSGGFRREFTIFSRINHQENQINPKRIEQLITQIRKEVANIRSRNQEMASEVDQIEKETIAPLPTKPGIYHIRYLESIIELLRGINARVGEAKTWLTAMISKKKKRGSAFLRLSKKKGTQYSLSQEHQISRSVQ